MLLKWWLWWGLRAATALVGTFYAKIDVQLHSKDILPTRIDDDNNFNPYAAGG